MNESKGSASPPTNTGDSLRRGFLVVSFWDSGALGCSTNAGTSEGGVGGALCGSGNGRGLPSRYFTQRSRHDCHG